MTDAHAQAHGAADAGHGGDGHHGPGHILPPWILLSTWGALMVLTLLTVFLAQFHLGAFDLLVAMTIATVKAALVCLFFMHLRWDRGFHSLLIFGAIIFVYLFLGFAMLDFGQIKPSVDMKEYEVLQNLAK